MKKEIILEKYPVVTLHIGKDECICDSADAVIGYFKERIEQDPIAAYIGTFDHYAHTKAIGGEIDPQIRAASNIIFCFGPKLPDARMLALRPRSIGVAETETAFIVTFLEAPMQPMHEKMESWAKQLTLKGQTC
jgi:hypothetical protein